MGTLDASTQVLRKIRLRIGRTCRLSGNSDGLRSDDFHPLTPDGATEPITPQNRKSGRRRFWNRRWGMREANTRHSRVGLGGCDDFDRTPAGDRNGNQRDRQNTTPALISHVLVGIR